MGWRYKEPILSDYDTEEEYKEALEEYEYALSSYIDDYQERCCRQRGEEG